MHSRPLGALVGGTTALLSLLTLSAGPSLAAIDEQPETSESDLLGVDEEGLGLPGARSSSTATSAATRTLTTNLPSLLRAPVAQTQASTAFTQAVAHHVQGPGAAGGAGATGAVGAAGDRGPTSVAAAGGAAAGSVIGSAQAAPAGGSTGDSLAAPAGASPSEFESSPNPSSTDELHSLDDEAATTASDTAVESSEPQPYGSVAQTTEDGIAIAALSEEMALPDDAPAVVGLVYDEQSDVEFEVRTQQDGEWSDWSHIHVEDVDDGNPGTDPYYVVGAESLQVRILGDDWDPSGTRILLVDPKTKDSDAEAVRDNQPIAPPTEVPAEAPAEVPVEDGAQAEQAAVHPGHRTNGATCTGAGCACPQCAGAAVPNAGMTVNAGLAVEAGRTAGHTVTGGNSTTAGRTATGGDSVTAGYTATGGNSATAVNTSASVKKVDKPTVRSRKDWGADEKLGDTDPAIASEATAAVVHHTDGQNDYDAEDVPAILRGIHTFHVEGRGWDDVGYNMFADSYGRLWEGRAGGLDKAVVGAHAAGYNTGTFGISVLGSYGSKAPPQKTLDAVSGAIAWKLSLSGTSADAKTTISGDTIRTVVGHRDVGETSCPGGAFYEKLGGVRSTAVEIQEGKRSVDPQDEKAEDKKAKGEKSGEAGDDKAKADDKKGGGGSGDDDLGGGVQDLMQGVEQD